MTATDQAPPSGPPRLSVVIPAYLEEENLRLILPRLLAVLGQTGLEHEVLVVDTEHPIDHTAEVCAQVGARHLPRSGGNRYGDAVRTGIGAARGGLVLFMDADGSHSPEFIPRLLEQAADHDVVIASRYVPGGATENPPSLIWMSRVLNLVYTVALGLPCRDVSNSFKLYRGELLRSLRLTCNDFDVIEEILVLASLARRPLRIKEVPFVFKSRLFGQTKRDLVRFVFSFAATLARLVAIRMRAR